MRSYQHQQQQGILIPQSKNFNSLDNIFTEYSEILYLGGLKLNRYGNVLKAPGFYQHNFLLKLRNIKVNAKEYHAIDTVVNAKVAF